MSILPREIRQYEVEVATLRMTLRRMVAALRDALAAGHNIGRWQVAHDVVTRCRVIPVERREHYLVMAEKYGAILDAVEFLQTKRIKKTT